MKNHLAEQFSQSPDDSIILLRMGIEELCQKNYQQADALFFAAGEAGNFCPDTARRILCVNALIAIRTGNISIGEQLLEEAVQTLPRVPAETEAILANTAKELAIAIRS